MGMSGSGYLWLVLDQRGRLGILPTFASGTPLVQARQQRGDPDSVSDKETSAEPPQEHSHPQARATGEVFLQEAERRATEMRTKRKQSHILEEINPLLCLSVHERAWMTDYGVWGKEAYLHNFWDVVDWTRLEASFVGLMGVRGQFLK